MSFGEKNRKREEEFMEMEWEKVRNKEMNEGLWQLPL